MFNSIFKDSVQGQKHPWWCVVAEPEIPSHRKPKCAVQNEQNCHDESPYNCCNHTKLLKGTHNDKQKHSYRLLLGAADQWTLSQGTYIHIIIYRFLNYTIETYILN